MNWHAESWALYVDFEANLWIGGGRALLALPQSWRAAKCLEPVLKLLESDESFVIPSPVSIRGGHWHVACGKSCEV
jgi:hypothetical protein